MVASQDLTNYFNQSQIDLMQELVDVDEELKVLEDKKKKLVASVKQALTSAKIEGIEIDGCSVRLTESLRRTVTKSTKDAFIGELVALGKQHLVTHSIEPDIESIFSEVDSGLLNESMVNKYIKSTPVLTLRITR